MSKYGGVSHMQDWMFTDILRMNIVAHILSNGFELNYRMNIIYQKIFAKLSNNKWHNLLSMYLKYQGYMAQNGCVWNIEWI